MSRKTRWAGALATAAMLITALVAGDGSIAKAESAGEFPAAIASAAVTAATGAPSAAAPAAEIRFVASPVVQDLTGEPAAAAPPVTPGVFASLHELVAATPLEGELAGELKCLAQAVYFESRGEPLAGQLAVARVVINRSTSGLFPGDYCSVVTQRAQFSFVRRGRIPAANERSDAWARAVRIARIAHEDLWPSDAGDALYFHAHYLRPRWASRKTARATIDNHIFYR